MVQIKWTFAFVLALQCILMYGGGDKKADRKSGRKEKFGLYDPRNPNCPCHKIQQQAVKGFKREKRKGGDGTAITGNLSAGLAGRSGNRFEILRRIFLGHRRNNFKTSRSTHTMKRRNADRHSSPIVGCFHW